MALEFWRRGRSVVECELVALVDPVWDTPGYGGSPASANEICHGCLAVSFPLCALPRLVRGVDGVGVERTSDDCHGVRIVGGGRLEAWGRVVADPTPEAANPLLP